MAKILIVEDDPLMSRMYQKIFTFEKYEVEMASDGQEGLKKARTGKPTMILLDVMMPQMSGYEVCKQIRQHFSLDTLPIIFLTAKKIIATKHKALLSQRI